MRCDISDGVIVVMVLTDISEKHWYQSSTVSGVMAANTFLMRGCNHASISCTCGHEATETQHVCGDEPHLVLYGQEHHPDDGVSHWNHFEEEITHTQLHAGPMSRSVVYSIKLDSLNHFCYRAVTQWFVVYSIKQDLFNQSSNSVVCCVNGISP